MGAKKILLSIISGEEAELQMDELTTITEYIQQQAGDDAEVIFGHGVDEGLSDKIRVTVIATGFAGGEFGTGRKAAEAKKVQNLDMPAVTITVQAHADNSVNQVILEPTLVVKNEPPASQDPVKMEPVTALVEPPLKEPVPIPLVGTLGIRKELVKEPEPVQREEPKKREPVPVPVYVTPESKPLKKEAAPAREAGQIWSLFDTEQIQARKEDDNDEDGEESLFGKDDDEFNPGEISSDQYLDEEGMMEYRKTKERLQQQAHERREKLKAGKTNEMSKDEFKVKWETPAYMRRGVKMDNVPHSSEPMISRYNLNDDNNLLGNNKFLHDNVD
jgi:cell division protein FtsZ